MVPKFTCAILPAARWCVGRKRRACGVCKFTGKHEIVENGRLARCPDDETTTPPFVIA